MSYRKHMHSEWASLFSGHPLWWLKRPCVWSEWFPFSRSEQISDTSDCSLTQPLMSAEQRRRSPINKACLIQPQPSSLPSSLCLREDTTAVTQTGVYPLLLAAVRRHHSHAAMPAEPERGRDQIKQSAHSTTKCWFFVPDCVVLTVAWGFFGLHADDEVVILFQYGHHRSATVSPHSCWGHTKGLGMWIFAKSKGRKPNAVN